MYRLGKKYFLKLDIHTLHKQFNVSCLPEERIFDNWSNTTRHSPIFSLIDKDPPVEFSGKWFFIFLYNCRVNELLKLNLAGNTYVFSTYSLANVFCVTKSVSEISKILNWVGKNGIKYEKWNVKDSLITKTSSSKFVESEFRFGKLVIHDKVIKSLYFEYLSNLLSIIKNVQFYLPEYESHFINLHKEVQKLIDDSVTPTEEKIEFLVSLNAGLSRFYGQAFSICSSILYNYCPVQNHSLLGIGIASVALLKLCNFYETVIGKEYLPDRINGFKNLQDTKNLILFRGDDLPSIESFCENEFINKTDLPEAENSVPVVPFYSARDGYKSGNRINISVPLITLISCNTLSWNLLTLTHELSHLQTRGCLSYIWPANELVFEDFYSLIKHPRLEIKNVHDYAKYLIGISTAYIHGTNYDNFDVSNISGKEISPIFSTKILIDIDETITHIFDFLYFYDGNAKNYLSSIWASWITIPYIEDRIEDYIVRTGTAILSNMLHENNWMESVFNQLDVVFNNLEKEYNHAYLKLALEMLKDNSFKERISNKITARLPLIVFTRALLYSTRISGKINKEVGVYSDHRGKEGYKLKMREFEVRDDRITNPISFLNEYSKENISSERNSVWIIYNLAFM